MTLKLKNVTVPEVLDAVRDAYGYDFHRMATGYRDRAAGAADALFQVDYIDLERRGTSRTRVASGQVGQSCTQQPTTRQAGSSPGALPQSSGLSEPPGAVFGRGSDGRASGVTDITGTSISTRSSSDFWHDLEVNLRALVGTDGRPRVFVNPQSGIIAVRAHAARAARRAAHSCTRSRASRRGRWCSRPRSSRWSCPTACRPASTGPASATRRRQTYGALQTGPQQGFGSRPSAATTCLLNQPSPRRSTLRRQQSDHPAPSTNTLGGAFALAVNRPNFSDYIELLAPQGKTRVLSSPRVSTLNNQKAVIKAGSDQYFVTGVSSNTVVGTSSATNLQRRSDAVLLRASRST